MRVHCAEFDITAPTGRNGIEQLIDVIAGQTASLHRSSPSDTLSCRWHDFRGQIGHSKLPGQILGGYDVGEVSLRPLMAAVRG